MGPIGQNLMSVLPFLLAAVSIFGVGFLAVRADGRGVPRSNSDRLSRLEERIQVLEQPPH